MYIHKNTAQVCVQENHISFASIQKTNVHKAQHEYKSSKHRNRTEESQPSCTFSSSSLWFLDSQTKISISPFSNNPIHVCKTHDELERFTEKKWRPRACSQGGRKIRMKGIWNNKAKKERERRGKEKGRKKKIGERIETSFREQSSS